MSKKDLISPSNSLKKHEFPRDFPKQETEKSEDLQSILDKPSATEEQHSINLLIDESHTYFKDIMQNEEDK